MARTAGQPDPDLSRWLARQERAELLRLLACGDVDAGKSTLIGRLLRDAGRVYEDQLAAIAGDGGAPNLALLVDGLKAERERGVTIDVAHRYFSTDARKFIIADAPGHERYTRNMVTGASTCDLALVLVDACEGVRAQTRRHSRIAALLGIAHVVVAVNKMDRVGFREDVYRRIAGEYLDFAGELGPLDIRFLPVAALDGDNVVDGGANMPWYGGPPLLRLLETIGIADDRNLEDFRFPVQLVHRPEPGFQDCLGAVASGAVERGDAVAVLPAGRPGRIEAIVTYDGGLERARAGMAVALRLADGPDIRRGDFIVHPGNPPATAGRIAASVVWMDEEPLAPGRRCVVLQGPQAAGGEVTAVRSRTGLDGALPGAALGLNEIGLVDIALERPICFDPYRDNRATGGIVLVDPLSNATVGAGMIERDRTADG